MDAPPVLLGYTQPKTMQGEMDIGVSRDSRTLLSMFLMLEPSLTQAEPMKEKVNLLHLECFGSETYCFGSSLD